MVCEKNILVIIIIMASFKTCKSVQINSINVPLAVKNDSNVSVIMDCNYSLRPDDTELVVKWYLNEQLVYQWIPPQPPQSFGKLNNKVDLNYMASDDPKSVYRAMKIYNPTNDIAGEYKCFVSTFTDEDYSLKKMSVFVPEKELEIFKSGNNKLTVNFTCMVSNVYPKPTLLLYKNLHDKPTRKNLPTMHWDLERHDSGRFSYYITSTVLRKSLRNGSVIHCELRIPDTGYVKITSFLYYPEALLKGTGSSCQHNCVISLIIILLLSFRKLVF